MAAGMEDFKQLLNEHPVAVMGAAGGGLLLVFFLATKPKQDQQNQAAPFPPAFYGPTSGGNAASLVPTPISQGQNNQNVLPHPGPNGQPPGGGYHPGPTPNPNPLPQPMPAPGPIPIGNPPPGHHPGPYHQGTIASDASGAMGTASLAQAQHLMKVMP